MVQIKDLDDDIKKAICVVKAKINGQVKKFDVEDNLMINYDLIESELEDFPHTYYLWAMLYSEVKEQQEVIEKKIRKRKGILYKTILDEGGWNLRRSEIDDLMSDDEVLMELELQAILIGKQRQKLWYILESLRMKNDNMRSLAGFRKQELFNTHNSAS
jgi:hypothetical protein